MFHEYIDYTYRRHSSAALLLSRSDIELTIDGEGPEYIHILLTSTRHVKSLVKMSYIYDTPGIERECECVRD